MKSVFIHPNGTTFRIDKEKGRYWVKFIDTATGEIIGAYAFDRKRDAVKWIINTHFRTKEWIS